MAIGKHEKNLERIINSLSLIDEDQIQTVFILKEPIWLHNNSRDMRSMCDIIIGYKNYAVPVEVKGSDKYRQKAISQVEQGRKFITNELGLHVPYGKIAYYAIKQDIIFETL